MKTMFTIMLLALGISAAAQQNNGTQDSIPTDQNVWVGDFETDIEIMQAKNGKLFFLQTSPRTGNLYPTWIGEETDEYASFEYKGKYYNNCRVRVSTSGKRFVLVYSTSGTVYCKYDFENIDGVLITSK